ncbi:MAG TPA: efflux RND transporter periplasmic adaptor subunit, partial [Sphingomonas sp.]
MGNARNIGGIAAMAAALVLGGCGGPSEQQQGGPPPAPRVGVVTVQTQPVTLTTELPGRLSAFETSEVRPQVNGIVLDRLFVEGDQVSKGQVLYRIDSQPYQAAVASARANLARSRASIASSAALARRYGELVRINAISRQDFENAQTSAAQARADVSAQTAALRTAQIELGRTTVRAPITGRIGRSVFTTGALVTAAQAEPLATIQRLDPVYVDIAQSSAEL